MADPFTDLLNRASNAAGTVSTVASHLPDFANPQVSDLIEGVVVESAWGPRISIVPGAKDPSSFNPGAFLKPKITVRVRGVSSPVMIAPFGQPGPTNWPWVAAGAVGVGLLAAYGLVKLLTP